MIYKLLKDKKPAFRVLLSAAIAISAMMEAHAADPVEKTATVISADTSRGKNNSPVVPLDASQQIAQEPVSLPSIIKNYMPGLTVGGYYRGYFYGRSMVAPYGTAGVNKSLSVGDGVYWGDPMLFMYVGGNITPAMSWGMELNLVNPMNGPAYNTNVFAIYNSMVMRGSYNAKKYGSYNIVVGGIEWKKISSLTFGGNVRYNRYSVFERQPWDPIGAVKTKYAAYYEIGNFSQDARFGTSAFKGIMINGFNLPGKLAGEIMVGKSGFSAGSTRADLVSPKGDVAGRLSRKFNNAGELSLNTFNSLIQIDSLDVKNPYPASINIYTIGYNVKLKDFDITLETGMGQYASPFYARKWDNAVILDLGLPKKVTYVPITMRYYRIGKGFVNPAASFSNTSIRQATTGYNSSTIVPTQPFGAGMGSVGDLANNKQGYNINTEIKLGKLKLVLGNEISNDLELIPGGHAVNIGHTINGLQWSRFSAFPSPGNFGPAGRVNSYYRGVYESITLTDSTIRKNYNSLEAQIRYKNKLFGRDFYIFQLNTFNSVQADWKALPVFGEDALARSSTHQLDIYYHVSRDLMIDFYYGYERIQSNKTKTIQYRDQTGSSIGLGFDLSISSNAALYYRHRWFQFKDANFADERFKGTEGTIELKLFF